GLLLAIRIIFLLLAANFQSMRLALSIILTIPGRALWSIVHASFHRKDSGTGARPDGSDGAIAICLFPGRRGSHGARPRNLADYGDHSAGVWRLSFVELRLLCLTRTRAHIRPQ